MRFVVLSRHGGLAQIRENQTHTYQKGAERLSQLFQFSLQQLTDT
jgi:hypothetical protein